MSFLTKFTPSQEQKTPMETSTIVALSPEPVGTVMAKLGIVWAGLIAGVSLGDIVLFATLIYTLLQIYLLVSERIVKPILAARRAVPVVAIPDEEK